MDESTKGRTAEEVTTERGKAYGHPMDQFNVVEKMMSAWRDGSDFSIHPELERALSHTVYMILTKLSRCCTDPLHMDNWADIKGYAHCFEMCVERIEQKQGRTLYDDLVLKEMEPPDEAQGIRDAIKTHYESHPTPCATCEVASTCTLPRDPHAECRHWEAKQ